MARKTREITIQTGHVGRALRRAKMLQARKAIFGQLRRSGLDRKTAKLYSRYGQFEPAPKPVEPTVAPVVESIPEAVATQLA
jgi:hypothetical protein